MNTEEPYQKSVSQKEFNGYWIPMHNAKVMKSGIENNTAPFLPDRNGQIKAEPVYSIQTGRCLPAARLLSAQFVKEERGYASNLVGTRSIIKAIGSSIRAGEKGTFYNFKSADGHIHSTSFFFAEQTELPDAMEREAEKKVKANKSLADTALAISSSEPETYMASYIAACKSGLKLTVAPNIVDEFKTKMLIFLNNDLLASKKQGRTDTLSQLLFNADKRSAKIIRELSKPQSNHTPRKTEQKQEAEITY